MSNDKERKNPPEQTPNPQHRPVDPPGPPPGRPKRDRDDRPAQPDRRHG